MDQSLTTFDGRRRETSEPQVFDPSRDVLAAVWRRPVLFLLIMAISLALGALYFLKAPPTYQSTAELLVELRRSPAFSSDTMRDPTQQNDISTATHTQILLSPVLIKRSLDELGLGNLPSFRDVGSPVDFALENLIVEEKELGSGVLAIKYRSKDAQECLDIVTSIVARYYEFLEESSKDIGDDTIGLIQKAQGELRAELALKSDKYASFRQSAPLLWEDGKGVNPHQTRQVQLEKARAQLEIDRSELVGKRNQVNAAILRGDAESVYFEAVSQLMANDVRQDDQLVYRETIRTLTGQLTELRLEEATLADQFSSRHPDLMSVREKIKQIERGIRESQAAMMPFAQTSGPSNYVAMYVKSLEEQITAISEQLADMDKVFEEEQRKAHELQGYIVEDETLRQDISRTQQLFDSVLARLDEINIVRDYGGYRASMLANPLVGKRVAPGLLRVGLASIFLGTLFGAGLCVLFEFTEATFRSPSEIQSMLQLPVIGRIPRVKQKTLTQSVEHPEMSPMLTTVHRHGSALAEAYRAVRTSLFFSTQGAEHKVIQVTSPLPGDGKSTLSANLAVTIAKSGKRVLLIDADFRRPTLHKIFGAPKENNSGLFNIVQGLAEPDEEALKTSVENLFLMPCGDQPNNPSELLSSPDFGNALTMLRDRFDFVIVDTPPLLAVTDPSAVAAWVDGTIMAIRLRRGVRVAASRAHEMLASVGANMLGVVVNNVDTKSAFGKNGKYSSSYGYGYGYGYGYTSEQPTTTSPSQQAKRLTTSAD